jgi:GNAT superfamily N-acetyltransferase
MPPAIECALARFEVRPLQPTDRDWVTDLVRERWGAAFVVSRGVRHHPADLWGFVAVEGGDRVGLITYHIEGGRCEIVTLDSLRPDQGIGTALIESVVTAARQADCWRVWLVTTNDNLHALGFCQKRGFAIAAVHPNALDRSRQLKPQIPVVGAHGIPLRDEIELDMGLRDRLVPDGWLRVLFLVSALACAGGVVLALGSPLFSSVLPEIYTFVFGTAGALSAHDRVMINVALGIGGGLQAGTSAILAFVTRYALRRGERWTWWACVVGLALWLALDTGLTAWICLNGYPRLWPKIANDLLFVGMFGVPYAAVYRHCHTGQQRPTSII